MKFNYSEQIKLVNSDSPCGFCYGRDLCSTLPYAQSSVIFFLGDPDIPYGIDWLLWFHISTVTVYECCNKVHSPLASQQWLTPTVHLSHIYQISKIRRNLRFLNFKFFAYQLVERLMGWQVSLFAQDKLRWQDVHIRVLVRMGHRPYFRMFKDLKQNKLNFGSTNPCFNPHSFPSNLLEIFWAPWLHIYNFSIPK